ncbi:MAG: hypothetical protein O6757_03145, partial [Alphaproteobacteria bacterium]|nr:hypothetical protein [Alphaproteobacteria bacterium]
ANYLVVASLLAGVLVELGAASGLVLPLIAVHLFVFYFGILADDTPPRRRRYRAPTPSRPESRDSITISAPRFCRSSSSSIPTCCWSGSIASGMG